MSPSEVDGGTPVVIDPDAEATACAAFEAVFAPRCLACHRPDVQPPDLSFEALPALVTAGLVVPGDPVGSLLFRKISGTQAPNEGGVMPPTGMLGADSIALVEKWIADGASFECEVGDDIPEPERYHPDDFAMAAVHGPELKLRRQDCRQCHGAQLEGAAGPSCDTCHDVGWERDCTFCHGGIDNDTGAPPRDLDEIVDAISFAPHTEHVTEGRHAAYDCTACHLKPDEVLSIGHVFDDSPDSREVRFDMGLSSAGSYADGTCSNLYCHGNGRTPGQVLASAGAQTCDDCHAGPNAGRDRWDTMSGEHEKHLREGLACENCHAATYDGTNIVNPALHVNGEVDIELSEGSIVRSGATCAGRCHGEDHDNESWND